MIQDAVKIISLALSTACRLTVVRTQYNFIKLRVQKCLSTNNSYAKYNIDTQTGVYIYLLKFNVDCDMLHLLLSLTIC